MAGQMYSSVWAVPSKQCAPASADPEFVPVEFAGRTLIMGGFVEYQQGSVLTYHEFFAGAMVRHKASKRSGSKVDHIWVDDVLSMRGGRELWGVPKQLARFDFNHQAPGGGFIGKMQDEQGRLMVVGHFTSGLGLPLGRPRVSMTGLTRLHEQAHGAVGALESTPRLVRARYTIPQDSPLAELGIAGRQPLMSFWLKDFRMLLPAATPVL
jgi:hypothetical protein